MLPLRGSGQPTSSRNSRKREGRRPILVDGNPLDDIPNIRKVEYVITNGAMHHTAELWQSVGFKP